ncbi:hypothetical protein C2R66_00905 [Helicobacter pylori]|nr:hypothetical protein C2R66_00905 [Helicobacter pylori]RKV29461.1 hypothetical protein DD756_07370 [Helicobacter pylori]
MRKLHFKTIYFDTHSKIMSKLLCLLLYQAPLLRKLKSGQRLSKHSKRLTENNLLNPYILKTMFSVSLFS